MGSAASVAVVVLIAVFGSVYQLVLAPIIHSGGIFRVVEPYNNQDCQFVSELQGCEKMVHHFDSGLLYMACSRVESRPLWLPAVGHLNASGVALGDGHVATYEISTGKITRLQLEDFPAGPQGLSTHGMDVVPSAQDPSLLYLYMVNHRAPSVGDSAEIGADSVIEIFETKVGSGVMKHRKTVKDTVILTPNDVVGFPDGKSFYFTNDHAVKTGLYRHLELYFNTASTSVGYCHIDEGCKIAASKVKGANGIVKSRTNDTIYVGSQHGSGLSVFDHQTDHTLLLSDTISTSGMPMDNLSVDKNGAVWAPWFPRGLEAVKRYSDLTLKAASGAFRFTTNTGESKFYGEKYKVDRMFEDDGSVAMGATSVVYVPEKNLLFLHGISAPHLTICKV